MSWDSNYYATQDTDHGGRSLISQQHKHLDWLVDLSSNDDYSSGYDNYSRDYHNFEGHIHGLCLIPGQYFGMRYGYDHIPQFKRSASTSIGGYCDCA